MRKLRLASIQKSMMKQEPDNKSIELIVTKSNY